MNLLLLFGGTQCAVRWCTEGHAIPYEQSTHDSYYYEWNYTLLVIILYLKLLIVSLVRYRIYIV